MYYLEEENTAYEESNLEQQNINQNPKRMQSQEGLLGSVLCVGGCKL